MTHPLRVFCAVDVGGEAATLARWLCRRFRDCGIEGRWSDPDRLHVTVWFFGDVMPADIPLLGAAMDRVGAASAPFSLSVGGVGGFPDTARPRTVWLGVREGARELTAIHRALAAELSPLGYLPEERGFRPHVTLGRLRDRASTARLAAEFARLVEVGAGSDGVGTLALLKSVSGRDGPRYETLHEARLVGG